MSTQIFPVLAGLTWPVKRSALWQTRKQVAISGKETALALWSYPRWQWELGFDFLRQGDLSGTAYAELAQLAGFFNARQGAFDSFLYADAEDNAVTGATLGIGDGARTNFPLVRSFGGFIEPILAVNALTAVKDNGTLVDPATYSVAAWGAVGAGTVIFTTAPVVGHTITADFTFYFPCRFVEDQLDFSKFMAALYELKSVKFISLK